MMPAYALNLCVPLPVPRLLSARIASISDALGAGQRPNL